MTLTRQDNGKTLYGVAYNILRRGVWQYNGVQYVHVPSGEPDVMAATAKAAVIRDNARSRIDVIAVAPAVGWKVADEHGEKLIA